MKKKKDNDVTTFSSDEPISTEAPAPTGSTVKITDLNLGSKGGKLIYEVSGVGSLNFAPNNLRAVTLNLTSGVIQTVMLADGWLVEQS